jgi:protoporphyrinogen/coproporphyrinogen III oxidase
MVPKVVILGGGITGLAAAHALLRPAGAFEITLVEREARLGGNIRTVQRDGFVMDGGPDSWVASKPHATALAKSLGLERRLIPTRPENRHVYIAWAGALHPLPEGMVLGIPTEVMPIVKTPLFSWDAKLRMALEPLIPPRAWLGDEDESIGDFVARRLGDEVAQRLAGPLLGGIFAGDAGDLSVRAAFPQFVDAEKRHGSLIRAMIALRAARRSGGGKEASAFLSLEGGLGELIDALAAKVAASVRVRTGVAARRIDRRRTEAGGFLVELDDGEALEADDLLLASPLPVTAELARGIDATLSDALGAFEAASTATAFLAYPESAVPRRLDATGFLVPREMRRPILASTWVSSKWEHRAPAGTVLLRVFFGGASGGAVLENDDAELVVLAREELRSLMGIEDAPTFTQVFRFSRASPQPKVGHLGRVRAVKNRLARFPGLYVAGNGFEGSGIPDCVKFAEAAAGEILARPR